MNKENFRIVYDVIENGIKKTYEQQAKLNGVMTKLVYDYAYGLDSQVWHNKPFYTFEYVNEEKLIEDK